MTKHSSRIYTYKITFEEVPYYYYGVHKEKKFGEYYMGSPKTNKWCWEFYTPKKQILEIFEFSDEGWLEANKVEKRIIGKFYNKDKWCLNDSCGGLLSLETYKKIGKKSYEEKTGIHALTTEERSKNGKKTYREKKGLFSLTEEELQDARSRGGKTSGKIGYKEGRGMFSLTPEEKSELGKRNGKKHYENGTGIFSLTPEEKSELSRKCGKISSSQVWRCTFTGYESTPCGLSCYQKKRGIDSSNRIRIK